MIQIAPHIVIDESELEFAFIRASGPGGQNVNKVATAAQLRFDVDNSPSLPDAVKKRLRKIAGKRLSKEGILIITAKARRNQDRNRRDALRRLAILLEQAAQPPKKRRKTKPSAAAKRRRLEAKRRHSQKKASRKMPANRGMPADW